MKKLLVSAFAAIFLTTTPVWAAPVINSIVLPGGGAPTLGGLNGRIFGSGFGGLGDAASVQIGGSVATILNRTATEIVFQTPTYTGGSRTLDARVTINAEQSNLGSFQYRAPSIVNIVAPLASLEGGSTFTINGNDFGTDIGSLSVTVGGQNASLILASHRQIQALLPAYSGGSAAQPVVVSGDGLDSNAVNVVYTSTPEIDLVVGASGPEIGGNTFTIFGNGFDPSSGLFVTVGGNQALVAFQSLTQIDVIAPPGSGQDVDIVVGSTTFGTSDTAPIGYDYQSVVAISTPSATGILGLAIAGFGIYRRRCRA